LQKIKPSTNPRESSRIKNIRVNSRRRRCEERSNQWIDFEIGRIIKLETPNSLFHQFDKRERLSHTTTARDIRILNSNKNGGKSHAIWDI